MYYYSVVQLETLSHYPEVEVPVLRVKDRQQQPTRAVNLSKVT